MYMCRRGGSRSKDAEDKKGKVQVSEKSTGVCGVIHKTMELNGI